MLAALRYGPYIACLAAVAIFWAYANILEHQRDVARKTALELTIKLADARAIQEDAERARQVAEAHARRAALEAARWGELAAELQSMEGGDAPLSDYLARATRRLWP